MVRPPPAGRTSPPPAGGDGRLKGRSAGTSAPSRRMPSVSSMMRSPGSAVDMSTRIVHQLEHRPGEALGVDPPAEQAPGPQLAHVGDHQRRDRDRDRDRAADLAQPVPRRHRARLRQHLEDQAFGGAPVLLGQLDEAAEDLLEPADRSLLRRERTGWRWPPSRGSAGSRWPRPRPRTEVASSTATSTSSDRRSPDMSPHRTGRRPRGRAGQRPVSRAQITNVNMCSSAPRSRSNSDGRPSASVRIPWPQSS